MYWFMALFSHITINLLIIKNINHVQNSPYIPFSIPHRHCCL